MLIFSKRNLLLVFKMLLLILLSSRQVLNVMFLLIEFVKQKLMQILQNRICVISKKCLRFFVVKFIATILLVVEMKLILGEVKQSFLHGKLMVKLSILRFLLVVNFLIFYLVMKKKIIIKSVLVEFMIEVMKLLIVNSQHKYFHYRPASYLRLLKRFIIPFMKRNPSSIITLRYAVRMGKVVLI